MHYRSKYIVIEMPNGIPCPVIFTELLNHVDVAEALRGNVVGAGFCYTIDDRYVCYGESVSCKVKSREDVDAKILNRLLGVDSD